MIRTGLVAQDGGKVEAQLKFWAERLHDLSGRNRLLYFRETKASSATIKEPAFLDLFHVLVEQGGELRARVPTAADAARLEAANHAADAISAPDELTEFLPAPSGQQSEDATAADLVEGDLIDEGVQGVPDEVTKETGQRQKRQQGPSAKERTTKRNSRKHEILTNHSVAQLNRVLYNLRYAARTVQEEQGLNILYVTFGMLRWRELHSSAYSGAPLLLVPVRLERDHPNSPYVIRMAEEEIVVNPVLQIKLLKDFGLTLPNVTQDISRAELQQFLSGAREAVVEQEGWDVTEKVTLGAFTFLTLLLVKDFETHARQYCEHPLVRWLSGLEPDRFSTSEPIPQAEELDDLVDPSNVYQVLDADSSQQEAIEAAKRGLSFILQGPPGTGKSQTIANIIAESIMAGKRVLFVSQKLAALEVVRSRLARKGLAEFCLEAHSHRVDKRQVVRDLMASLAHAPVRLPNPDYRARQTEIREIREALNSYVRQLHEPALALALSPYQLQGRLAQFLDAPALDFRIADIKAISIPELNRMLAIVRDLATYTEIVQDFPESRWRGYHASESSLANRAGISSDLHAMGDALEALHEGASAVALTYGLRAPQTIGDDRAYAEVLTCFRPEIFSTDMRGVISRYKGRQLSGGKHLSIQYGSDAAKLKDMFQSNVRPTTEEVSRAVATVSALVQEGSAGAGQVRDRAEMAQERIAATLDSARRIEHGYAAVRSLFAEDQMPDLLGSMDQQSAELVSEWLHDLAAHTDELEDWADFNALRQLAEGQGLTDFVNRALDARIPADQWEGAFSRRFYQLCMEEAMRDRPALQRFRGRSHAELIRRFQQLDRASIDQSAHEIRAHLSKRKPQWSWMKAESAETSILRREFNKKRRLKPLRRLFAEIPNLIQALKPCVMMSPLTVCQLLDPAIHQFDLAVFDEASQIPPEYAISAFLRARQVVIAGDNQQLPPTNFFQTMEGEEPEDEEGGEEIRFESILSLCDSRGFPNKMLNWHYRSRDESLIAYSNHHFYDDRLYTFPNPQLSNPATGLKFVHVDHGVYYPGEGARHNLEEAKRVVELAYEHLQRQPELSLGIVTFSVPQRRAVEAEIDSLRIRHREVNELFGNDAREPLFVKNLENVQGDERDVIILSVGYGRDEGGRMALNFGPINRDGGARRLNVAVTRARYLVYLVASIQPEDIDLGRATSQGAMLLRSYLETARDGVQALMQEQLREDEADFASLFEESVFRELGARGLDLARRVGVSRYRIDLAVRDPNEPGRFLLGLECDGPMYRSGVTARDRDRLRQQVLEGLGWRVHRIWSRDWIRDREAEISRILKILDSREMASDRGGPDRLVPAPAAEAKRQQRAETNLDGPAQAAAGPAAAAIYTHPVLHKPTSTGTRAFAEAPLSQIIDALQALANAEGPISIRIARTLVLETWGARQSEKVNQKLDSAVQRGAQEGAFRLNGNFLWPTGRHVAPLRIHAPGLPHRSIADIAPEEIESGARECVKGAITISRQDLVRETAKLFGLKNTAANSAKIDGVVQQMISRRVLRIESGRISADERFPRPRD